jgi:hypothetical protein
MASQEQVRLAFEAGEVGIREDGGRIQDRIGIDRSRWCCKTSGIKIDKGQLQAGKLELRWLSNLAVYVLVCDIYSLSCESPLHQNRESNNPLSFPYFNTINFSISEAHT